jgi:hypothetical protein
VAALTLEDIRLGDTVRLRNGETIVVDSRSSWYEDATGRHTGPFVSPSPGFSERYLLADVVEVVARNPRRCVYCGDGVTSTNPEVTFCRGCHYAGTHDEAERAELFRRLSALENVSDVGVWHTGGGCKLLAVTLVSGEIVTCTEYDAILPAPGDNWGLLYVHRSLEDYEEQTEWLDERAFTFFEGEDEEKATLTDDGLVEFVRGWSS